MLKDKVLADIPSHKTRLLSRWTLREIFEVEGSGVRIRIKVFGLGFRRAKKDRTPLYGLRFTVYGFRERKQQQRWMA